MKKRIFILTGIILCILLPLWGSHAEMNGLLATISSDNSDVTVTALNDHACPRCGNQPVPNGSFVALLIQNGIQFRILLNEENIGSGCASKLIPSIDKTFILPISAHAYYCSKCGFLKANLDPISFSLFRNEKGIKVVSHAEVKK